LPDNEWDIGKLLSIPTPLKTARSKAGTILW
jgi:hypothetical protein